MDKTIKQDLSTIGDHVFNQYLSERVIFNKYLSEEISFSTAKKEIDNVALVRHLHFKISILQDTLNGLKEQIKNDHVNQKGD